MADRDDFWGDYVAPGAFFTGLGVASYRTVRDVKSRNIVTNTWEGQKAQREFFSSLNTSRVKNRHAPYLKDPKDLINSLFYYTSRYSRTAKRTITKRG